MIVVVVEVMIMIMIVIVVVVVIVIVVVVVIMIVVVVAMGLEGHAIDIDRLPEIGVLPIGSDLGAGLRVEVRPGVRFGLEMSLRLGAVAAVDPRRLAAGTHGESRAGEKRARADRNDGRADMDG
jgi:hypothetical protein